MMKENAEAFNDKKAMTKFLLMKTKSKEFFGTLNQEQ